MNHDTKGLEMTHSRNAWIALFLVVFGLAIPVLWVLVTGSAPRTGNPIQLLFILLLIIGFSLSVGALRLWPARIAFGLCCLVVIGSFASNAMRPDPFQKYAHKISKGMLIREVESILGEPVEIEPMSKLVKVNVPEGTELYDDEGNPLDKDRVVKAVDNGHRFHFKIRNTNIEVIFDDQDRVKDVLEYWDAQ